MGCRPTPLACACTPRTPRLGCALSWALARALIAFKCDFAYRYSFREQKGITKNFLRKIHLYILHSAAASLPSIRVSRSRKHPRASCVASEWPSEFRTPFGPDQVTCVTVRVDIHTS